MDSELYRFCNAVLQWRITAEKEGYQIPTDAREMYIYMLKSSLLKRLLKGDKPYPFAPPKFYSYPHYDLMETGFEEGYFDWYDGEGTESDQILICQSFWHILSKEDDVYRLCFNPEEGSEWLFSPMNYEEVLQHIRSRSIPSFNERPDFEAHVRGRLRSYRQLKRIKPGANGPAAGSMV